MAVQYYLPGLGLAKFDDGTTPEQAFKIAGIDLPAPESKGAQLIPSLKRGAGGLVQGVGSAIKDVYPETGEAVEQYGKGVVDANPAAYPDLSSVHSIGGALGYAGERLAESAPLAVGGLVAGAAGGPVASAALMGGGMAAQTYGDVREKQRVNGNDNIPAAVGAGVLAGGLGVLGGEGAAIRGAFGKAAEDAVPRSLLRSGLQSAGEQAAINPTIAAASRAASGESVSDSDAVSDYVNQAVSGAVVGGAFGLGMHPFQKKPVSDTDPTDLLKKDLFGREGTPHSREPEAAPVASTLRATSPTENAPGQLDLFAAGSPSSEDFYANRADTRGLPHPYQFTKPVSDRPLYTDDQGNVGKTPNLRAEAMEDAPNGSQGNLFRPEPDQPQTPVAPPTPQRADAGGQASPLPLQPDLFRDKPVAANPTDNVKADFGPKEVLQRIQRANFYEKDIKGKPQEQRTLSLRPIDAKFTTDLADGVAQNLAAGNSAGAQQHIDLQLQTLKDSKTIGTKGIEVRKQALKAAQEVVHDFNARMVDAYAQEAKQRAPEPGAQVSTGPTGMSPDDIVAQQRQAELDAQQHQDKLAAVAKQHADAADQLAQANQTITDSHRNAIVQKALNDPNETNHAARVADTLKRNGLDPELRPHEQEAVDRAELLQRRRADATDAFSKPDTVEDTGGTDNSSMESQIPERQAAEPQPAAPPARDSNTTRGYHAPENFRLEAQSEDAFQRLEDAKRRREAREASPEPTGVPDRTRQMFHYGEHGATVRKTANPNSPESFKLERPRPGDIHEPAAEPQKSNGLTSTPSNRQGEMFTPTGRIKKSADQGPFKTEVKPKSEDNVQWEKPAGPDTLPRIAISGEIKSPWYKEGTIHHKGYMEIEPQPNGDIHVAMVRLTNTHATITPADIKNAVALIRERYPDAKRITADRTTGSGATSFLGKEFGSRKVEANLKAETRGDKIKREVAEKNAKTRQRTKEKLNAVEARTEPQGDREQYSGAGEDRPTAAAGGGDRVEESRQGQAQTSEVAEAPPLKLYSEQTRRLVEMRQEKKAAESNAARAKPEPEVKPGGVTYDSVMRDAERNLARDGESGLLKPKEYQQLSMLAEQKNVPPERLQEMLNKAIERNSTSALEEATGTRTKRQFAEGEGERPDFTWYEMGKAADRLQKRLNQLGLRDAGLAISHDLIQTKDGPANAAYSPTRKLIQVAMNAAKDMGKSLDHEVVHHLLNVGVITKPEFDQMVRALRRNKDLSAKIDEAYKHLDQAGRDEEGVAELFARWANGDKSVLAPQGILNKIKSFFDAVRQAFTSQGFKSAEDIFKAIDSGQIGARPRGGLERPAGVARESQVSPELTKARSAAIDELPERLRPVAHGILDSLSDFKNVAVSRVAFTEDLVARAKTMMPSGIKYVKDMTAKAQEYREHEQDYQKSLDSFQALKTDRQRVGDGTINGVIQEMNNEKKWGFDPEFLTRRKDNPLAVTVDPDMAAKFNALPKVEQDIVKEVFRKNHEMLQLQKEAAVKGSTGIYDAAIAKATADGKPKSMIDSLKAERQMVEGEFQKILDVNEADPYNPQRRYGKYVAFAKSRELLNAEAAGDSAKVSTLKADEDHYFMRQYDTFAQAQAVVRELRKLGQFDNVLDARETDQSTDHLVGARGMMLAFQQLRNFIKDQVADGDINPKVLDGINKLAADLYIRSLRQSSSRKSELRRLGVSGGDMDQMRNHIVQGRATAHFIAAMKHNDNILDTISKMRDEAKSHPDKNAMTLFNEIVQRHGGGMTFDPAPFANQVKKFTGAYMIISSPAFYLEQIMQPSLLSTPYMAGRHGYTTSVKSMADAYKSTAKLWSGAGHGQLDTSKIPDANVRRAIDELSNRGIINVGQHMELGTSSAQPDRGTVLNGAEKVYRFFSDLTSKLEAVNRVSTGIAAYKLERTRQLADGKSTEEAHAAATDYAHKVIYDTHGSYDGFNAPRFMRGPVLGIVTQFKKFSIMQASLLAKLASGAMQEADPVQRAAMQKALAFTVAHAAILGGAMALPGAATAKWVTNKLLTTDNEPGDIEQKIREWLGDEALSNILLKGVPTLGTHGVDISDRVGLGTATSVFPFLKDDPGTSYVDTTKSALLSLLGPTLGSIAPQWADGLDLMHQWNYWKGLEKFLPKGFANASKAVRESQEGVTNRRDDLLMKPEDISFGHSFATALGIPTAAEEERLRGSNVENTKEQFYKDRTRRITMEFTDARRAGDTAGMADARQRFMELQTAKWNEGLPRSPLSTLISAAQNQRLRERSTVEGVQFKAHSPGLRRAREEAQED